MPITRVQWHIQTFFRNLRDVFPVKKKNQLYIKLRITFYAHVFTTKFLGVVEYISFCFYENCFTRP